MSRVPGPQAPTLNPVNTSSPAVPAEKLRPALPGLILGILTILFGFGLGIVFGANEAIIKGRLTSSAQAVFETTYKGDTAAMKAVTDKSWEYMQRAHLHAGALGTTAMALTLTLLALGTPALWTRVLGTALGAGGLGYSIYWMLAGFRAPGMGSTGAAKESLDWLAMPSSGAVLLATIAVAILLIARFVKRPPVSG